MGGISAASGGRAVEAGDLESLQARMKKDPEGYEDELLLQLRHFDACVSIMLLQSSSSVSQSSSGGMASTFGDASAAKEVAEVALFLAHMAPFYPQHLKQLPWTLLRVLDTHKNLESNLRRTLTQAVILLRNRKMVGLEDLLPVMMDLQCGADRAVRKLAFLHVVHDIRRMNRKHKNDPSNKKLQTALFNLLQSEDETKAKRALIILAELHRRKVWVDDRSANAICYACLHKSPRIMIAAMRFLLGYDEQKEDDEDDSESDEEEVAGKSSVSVQREAIYKAYHKGTVASKKKKQHKLQRAVRSMKKQQRAQAKDMQQGSHAPLEHVVDPQSFVEKLFARLRTSNEKFEVKLMMMQVISRAIGINRLMLLNFYPFLQKYIEPHQRDVTLVLAAAVQACHDLVPPDAVESLVRQLVNHFVHDRARPEVIALGLNTMREICTRIPLVMTYELLTDLALYKKNREKAVAAAARSIISVYRQLWPSLLEKKDRGRNADLAAMPKAFGATTVHTGVEGVELLFEDDNDDDDGDDSENDKDQDGTEGEDDAEADAADDDASDGFLQREGSDDEASEMGDSEDDDETIHSDLETDEDDVDEVESEENDAGEEDNHCVLREDCTPDQRVSAERLLDKEELASKLASSSGMDDPDESGERESKRRKMSDQGVDANVAIGQQSLRSLKKLSSTKGQLETPANLTAGTEFMSKDGDGILSNEDFQHIRSLQAKRAAKVALAASGLKKSGKTRDAAVKISTPDALTRRRVDPSTLEANVRKRREKEERIAMAQAGREDRQAYGSRTATKQKKTGGSSNREKEKRKAMPLGAVRWKVARNKGRKGKMNSKNQFRGKKAWK